MGVNTVKFIGSPDESLRAFIGDRQGYYMQRFERFEANGKTGLSWHWPALFVTFYWLLYRKMWLGALLYFFAPYVALFVAGFALAILGVPGDTAVTVIWLMYFAAMCVLPPLYANALYYRHAKAAIREAELGTRDPMLRFAEIARRGGTSGLIMFVVVFFGLIAMIGILAAIAIPAYVDYENKGRMQAGVLEGDKAAAAVGRYYETHQAIPATLADAGYTLPQSAGMAEIILDTENGSLSIVATTGQHRNKKIVLMPTVSATQKVSWACGSEDIPDKLLPAKCHRPKPLD